MADVSAIPSQAWSPAATAVATTSAAAHRARRITRSSGSRRSEAIIRPIVRRPDGLRVRWYRASLPGEPQPAAPWRTHALEPTAGRPGRRPCDQPDVHPGDAAEAGPARPLPGPGDAARHGLS